MKENGWGLYQNVAKTYLKVVTEPDFWFRSLFAHIMESKIVIFIQFRFESHVLYCYFSTCKRSSQKELGQISSMSLSET